MAAAPTLADMKAEIADDLARDDLTTQIASRITKAIRHFQSERFFFNEQYVTFTTVAGQEYYGSAANALLPDLYAVDSAVVIYSATQYELDQAPDRWIELATTPGERGQPAFYSYFNRQVRIYPVPDAVYTVRIAAHVRIDPPATDADTNPWVDEGADLIAARAKWLLALHVTKDAGLKSAMEDAQVDAIGELRGRTARAAATGQVQSYDL